jgi:hypothetical protein
VGNTLAYADIEINGDLRLCGLKLVVGGGGRFVVYAANSRGMKTATFSRKLTEEITRAVSAAWEEMNGTRTAA